MKKTKTSARIAKTGMYHIALRDDIADGIFHLYRAHGLPTFQSGVSFILSWAIEQQTITPDPPYPDGNWKEP
jgi:hypothetical protein